MQMKVSSVTNSYEQIQSCRINSNEKMGVNSIRFDSIRFDSIRFDGSLYWMELECHRRMRMICFAKSNDENNIIISFSYEVHAVEGVSRPQMNGSIWGYDVNNITKYEVEVLFFPKNMSLRSFC